MHGWARELGIELGASTAEGTPQAAAGGGRRRAPGTTDDAIRALAIKGYCDPAGLAGALGCAPEEAAALLDLLVAEGLAELAAGSFRLTPDGKAVGAELLAADGAAWGVEHASAALDDFIVLDHRMKDIVTAWQMKGEGVLQRPCRRRLRRRGAGPPGRAPRRRRGLARAAGGRAAAPRPLRRPARGGRRGRRRGRREVHRVAERGQLPRRLVRAPRGPDPARGPDTEPTRLPRVEPDRGRRRSHERRGTPGRHHRRICRARRPHRPPARGPWRARRRRRPPARPSRGARRGAGGRPRPGRPVPGGRHVRGGRGPAGGHGRRGAGRHRRPRQQRRRGGPGRPRGLVVGGPRGHAALATSSACSS